MQKTVSEVLERWYFPYSVIWLAGQWEGLLVYMNLLLF